MDKPHTRLLRKLGATSMAMIAITIVVLPEDRAQGVGSGSTTLQRSNVLTPTSESALDQVIEVARMYQLPMGIEWTGAEGDSSRGMKLDTGHTVGDLLASILRRTEGYQLRAVNGVYHVVDPTVELQDTNPLNSSVSVYEVGNANVFEALAQLRWQMMRDISPEKYGSGFVAGYGYGALRYDKLDAQTITITGRNLRVRDILDRIIIANGNALWVARVNRSNILNGSYQGLGIQKVLESSEFSMQILPIKDVKE